MKSRSLHWSIRLGQLAVSLMLFGIGVMVQPLFQPTVPTLQQAIASHPRGNAAMLATDPGTTTYLFEGQIGPQNEALIESLVAYHQARAVIDIRGERAWSPAESVLPSLEIMLADGVVAINGNYHLTGQLHERMVGEQRYQGVAVGDPVIVIGTVMPVHQPPLINASYLIAGRVADYQKPVIPWTPILFGGCLLLSGLGLVIWLWRRGYRPFGDRATGR
ncbi:MAG: hypothetical protein Fur005_48670 [Roseiflexaceae bacterium]